MPKIPEEKFEKREKKFKIISIVISASLYVISLTQTALVTDDQGAVSSLVLLLTGWMGPLLILAGSFSTLSWFANPFIFAAWLWSIKIPKRSLICSIIASLLSSGFLLFDTIIASEAPTYANITAYKSGYWLWLVSMLFFSVSSITMSLVKNNGSKVN